jgi:anaerobic ribonucleoside-triphosphate reductase
MNDKDIDLLYDESVSELSESKGMKLAKRIEQLFKDRCAEFKKEYKLNFGVYFTPRFQWAA